MNDALLSNLAAVPDPMPTPLTPTQALARAFEFDVAPSAGTAVVASAAPRAVGNPQGQVQARQGIRIGSLGLMLAYELASELTEVTLVRRLPYAPAWLLGMTNLHGALVPLLSLAEYLGLSGHGGLRAPDGSKRMMLVLGAGPDAVGVLVDGLPQRLRFEAADRVEDAPVPERIAACVGGTYWIGEQAWLDFTPAPLFAQLELELKASA